MNIKPIRTEQDYEAALRAVEPMFENEPALDTPEGDYFEVMCLLIEDYEKKHYPMSHLPRLRPLSSAWNSKV